MQKVIELFYNLINNENFVKAFIIILSFLFFCFLYAKYLLSKPPQDYKYRKSLGEENDFTFIHVYRPKKENKQRKNLLSLFKKTDSYKPYKSKDFFD